VTRSIATASCAAPGHDGNYSTKKLGAIGADLGAVAAFFDEPWTRLSPNLSAPDQAWLLNEAAFRLRALGRLTEAVEPMRVGIENWRSGGLEEQPPRSASNLSELEVTLGRLSEAVADGRRAIEFADRSGDAFCGWLNRTTVADALHQAGERAEAGRLVRGGGADAGGAAAGVPAALLGAGFRYCRSAPGPRRARRVGGG
jgi:hypothetical protein